MADDHIRWIDLSAYGMTLHALRLPSGRVALVVAGNTAAHAATLTALGFRRTRQGHVVRVQIQLKLSEVRVQLPEARVRDMARAAIVRIGPSVTPVAAPPAETRGHTDHRIHNATLLGTNRRGQQVYEDGAEQRYLVGDPEGDHGPLADSDYLRLTGPDHLPEVVAGLIHRAERNEKLTSEALQRLAPVIAVPPGQPSPSLHDLQEALEVAAVRHFREWASGPRDAAWRDGAPPPTGAFRAALRLAQHLPPVAARSGETLAWAQFSTPLPLAVAARTLLGPIGPGRSLLEPTAGHGALLLGLPVDARLTAVEIDPDRARRLERMLSASGEPATERAVDRPGQTRVLTGDILRFPPAEEPYDYILANPPYGSLAQHRLAAGNATRVRLGEVSFPTRRLDHWILLETLKQRHPLGRAVYLIGADPATCTATRALIIRCGWWWWASRAPAFRRCPRPPQSLGPGTNSGVWSKRWPHPWGRAPGNGRRPESSRRASIHPIPRTRPPSRQRAPPRRPPPPWRTSGTTCGSSRNATWLAANGARPPP